VIEQILERSLAKHSRSFAIFRMFAVVFRLGTSASRNTFFIKPFVFSERSSVRAPGLGKQPLTAKR